jgi:hypothetical protein
MGTKQKRKMIEHVEMTVPGRTYISISSTRKLLFLSELFFGCFWMLCLSWNRPRRHLIRSPLLVCDQKYKLYEMDGLFLWRMESGLLVNLKSFWRTVFEA